jgi:hypothetical protein
MKYLIGALVGASLFVMPVGSAFASCGYKSDGNYHCGDNCGYKSDGNYHCE